MHSIGEYHNHHRTRYHHPYLILVKQLTYSTVNNLVPETLYIFHIIARNEFGDSLSKLVKCTTDESMYEVVYITC